MMISILFSLLFNSGFSADCPPVPEGMAQGPDCSVQIVDTSPMGTYLAAEGEVTALDCKIASFKKRFYKGEFKVTKTASGPELKKLPFEFMMDQSRLKKEVQTGVGQRGKFFFQKSGNVWRLTGLQPANSASFPLPNCEPGPMTAPQKK